METPVSERSAGTNEELRGDPLHEFTENENQNKHRESKEVQRDISHELPNWLQELRENLVDESTSTEPWGNPEQGSRNTSSSSHEPPMESRAQVEPASGEQSVYTHFPRDPTVEICLKTKLTRASCRRRAGTVVPREEIWITKFSVKKVNRAKIIEVLWRRTRFGNAVVTILPVQNKNFSGDPEEPNEVPPDEENKSHSQ